MRDANPGKAERTRRYIIEKAAPIFNKKGYYGTSLSDLTQATGLTKGSIYGNFANKEEVALEAFEANVGVIMTMVAQEVEAAETSLDKLLAYPRAYRKFSRLTLANGGCPIANTAVDADDTNPALARRVAEIIRFWEKSLKVLTDRGKKAGEIKADTDSARVARTIIALIEGGSIMSKATGEDGFYLNAVEQVEELINSLRP
jgi:AcrR family transcriptional regulator